MDICKRQEAESDLTPCFYTSQVSSGGFLHHRTQVRTELINNQLLRSDQISCPPAVQANDQVWG